MKLSKIPYRFYQMSDGDGGGAPPSADSTDGGAPSANAGPAEPSGNTSGGKTSLSIDSDQSLGFLDKIPDKYRVMSGEGDAAKLDINATFEKTVSGYNALAELQGRGGDGVSVAPESIDGYTLTNESIGEKFDVESELKSPLTKKFLEGAHKLGMTNELYQYVTDHFYTTLGPAMLQGKQALSYEQSEAKLLEIHGNADSVDAIKVSAVRALKSISGDNENEFNRLKQKFGNDPDFINVMAVVGREMTEDDPAKIDEITGGESLDSLVTSDAYLNPKHKDHANVAERVRKAYSAKFGQKVVQ